MIAKIIVSIISIILFYTLYKDYVQSQDNDQMKGGNTNGNTNNKH